MDPHVRWLRRRIAGAISRIALIWLAVATGVAFLGLVLATATAPAALVPWALLIGQLTVLVGLGRAALSNPLNVMYLLGEAERPRRYEPANQEVGDDTAVQFAPHRLSPLIVLGEPGTDEPAFDLFQTPRRTVTMARNRQTGSVSFCSRLSDDRILLTDTLLSVPHQRLVLNRAGDADINTMIDAHSKSLGALADRGIAALADDGQVFLESLAVEHDALLTLGTVLAPFLSLGPQGSPLRFLVTIDSDELVKRTMASPVTDRHLVAN